MDTAHPTPPPRSSSAFNDGIDPEEELLYYQGKSLTKDGVYIGTYSFFIFVATFTAAIAFLVWQVVPRWLAPYLLLEAFFSLMPDQSRRPPLTRRYWALVIPSTVLMLIFAIILGYWGIMTTLVVDPASPDAYTDGRSSEITRKDTARTSHANEIPPIEDCDVVLVSRFLFAPVN